MLNSFPVSVCVGTLLGFLSGLGTGGGSLLILWLTLVLGMPQVQARIMNLLFFIPAALVACIFRWKQGRLDIRKVLPAICVGSAVSAFFSFISTTWNTDLLQKLFGFLLLFTGIRELLYQPKER